MKPMESELLVVFVNNCVCSNVEEEGILLLEWRIGGECLVLTE